MNEKITLTEKEKEIIEQIGDSTYTVSFMEKWINWDGNAFNNLPAALQSMGAHGFYHAVQGLQRWRFNYEDDA